MAIENGIVVAPIGLHDVAQALGESSEDVATLCTSEKINPWAFDKPVYGPSIAPIASTPMNYISHTALKTYTIGDAQPTNGNAVYIRAQDGDDPTYRITDFDGYAHNEHPLTFNLASLEGRLLDIDNPAFETSSVLQEANISDTFRYLINGPASLSAGSILTRDWDFGMLIIATYGSDVRYFLYRRGNSSISTLVFPSLPFTPAWRKKLIDMGIENYTCQAVAVAWPYGSNEASSLDFSLPIIELKPDCGFKFFIFPQTGSIKPLANGIQLTRPKDMAYIEVVIVDNSDYTSYIPDGFNLSVDLAINNSPAFYDIAVNLYNSEKQSFYGGYEDTPLYGQDGWTLFAGEYTIEEANVLVVNYLRIYAAKYTDQYGTYEFNISGNFNTKDDRDNGVDFLWNEQNLKEYPNQKVILYLGLSVITEA